MQAIDCGLVPGTITVSPASWINQGSLVASSGAGLSLNGTWTNAAEGTITATAATLNLGGYLNYLWSNAGTITATQLHRQPGWEIRTGRPGQLRP